MENKEGEPDLEGTKDWYKEKKEKFLMELRDELIARMEPIINTVVTNLRSMEREVPGSGKEELIRMLKVGEINESMFKVVRPSLDDIDRPYKVDLSFIKPIEATKLG